MKFKIRAYNLQELGQRKNQEDSLFPELGKSTPQNRLFVLCDGMGGHEKGEVASATVCQTLSNTILSQWHTDEPLSDELFQKALDAAYDALDAKDDGEERKMGTTMTFLCLHAKGATVAHIGDSRIYQLRPASKKTQASIVFRTQDHSLVNDLVKIGEITEEEAKHHPQKNVITRAMQPCQEHRAKADIDHLTDIQPGDYFFMCSDGMLEQTSDENLLIVITMPKKTDEEKIEMLRNMTDENLDNHTAHLIHIDKVKENVRIVENVASHIPIKGRLVIPEFDKPKNNKKAWLWKVVASVIVAIIAACLLFFFFPKRYNATGAKGVNSYHRDSVKAQKGNRQDGTQRKNTSTHQTTAQHHENGGQDNKPSEDKKANKSNHSVSEADQSTTKNDTIKPSIIDKVIKLQFKKEVKDNKRTTKPHDKKI